MRHDFSLFFFFLPPSGTSSAESGSYVSVEELGPASIGLPEEDDAPVAASLYLELA